MKTYGRRLSENNFYKVSLLALLILFCIRLVYYFDYTRGIQTILTDFFYVPIALAGVWWGRRSILVALFLGGTLLVPHIMGVSHSINDDFLRITLFIIIAWVIGTFGEKTLRYEVEINRLFQTVGDGLRIIDQDFNVLRVNEKYLSIVGLGEDELLYRKCYEVFPSTICHTSDCLLTRILNGEEMIETEVEKESGDGVKIPCIVTVTPFRGHDGQILGIVEALKDITERKQAAEALREQKEFAENLIQNFQIPAFVLDARHNVLFWNKACEKLTGFKASELIGTDKHWQAFYDIKRPCISDIIIDGKLEDLPAFYNAYAKSDIIKDGLHGEGWFPDIGGKKRYMLLDAAPIYNGKGELIAVIETIQDITKRRRAEEALYEREQQYRAAFDQAAIGIAQARIDGRFFYVNQKYCDIIGYSKEELINLTIEDITSPDDLDETTRNLRRLVAGEVQVYTMEKRYIRKDGSLVWVNLTVSLVRAPSGEPKYFVGVVEDISDRRQAQEALWEQKEFVENLIQNSAVPTFVLDAHHNILFWNKACEELTGLKGSELIGTDNHWQAFYDYKRPCLADVVIKGNVEVLHDFYGFYSESGFIPDGLHSEGWYHNLGGRDRYIVFDAAPIHNSKGEIIAAIETLHDFSAWKRAEEELVRKDNRIQKELQLANAVQASLFPIKLPLVPGVTLAATTVAAKEVGGDYCDLFVTKDKKLGIAIGDVMGKGVPAALFVSMTYAFVRDYAAELDSPAKLVKKLNRDMFHQLEYSGQFITFFYGMYNPETRELIYTNAGHNQPFVYRAAAGDCEILQTKSFFIGGRQEADFQEGKIALEPGDIVLFYTDGLKEGRNKAKEQFGTCRITDIIIENCMLDPASIEEIMISEFNDFLAGEPQNDDITMALLKII